ncbi:MAG TPA: tetratricopeptide repeat protein [Longimicrobiales bacterium]|nr:tetratricopeptide repeat protein [Longimicrobiales bacterium]
MLGRLKLTLAASALAVLAAPALVQAQEGGRFRVIIPRFEPQQNADRGFGRDVAEELRDMINTLPTHIAMDEDDIEDEIDQFNMDMDDLNCITTIQVAAQINVPVAVCATYTEDAQRNMTVSASIRDVNASTEFALDPFTVPRNQREQAARQIFTQFDRFNTQVRSAGICNDYAASQQWENALRNCDESLAINPDASSVRFLRGRVLYEMERFEEALEELETVLDTDPFHEEALQLAGYINTTQGDAEAGREHYRRYLDINPGNVAIRMRIAYEMAQAGDPVGAMEFIQVGLEVDANNVDLLDQYGGFAFAAALQAQDEYNLASPQSQQSSAQSPTLAPEAADFYREAIEAYLKVFETRGAETQPDRLRNIVAAYIQLEDLPSAIDFSERVLETHPEEERVWTLYADALQRSGRLEDAIAALDRLLEIQPDHPTASLRQGQWLIQAKRIDEAVPVLTSEAQKGERQADQAARLFFNEGYTNGHQQNDYGYSIRNMTAGKQLPNVSAALGNQLNFWHGFGLYSQAMAEQEPQTLASAQATLPKFRQALELFNQSGNYPASVNVNMTQLLEATNTYIEIQDAIIRRGR